MKLNILPSTRGARIFFVVEASEAVEDLQVLNIMTDRLDLCSIKGEISAIGEVEISQNKIKIFNFSLVGTGDMNVECNINKIGRIKSGVKSTLNTNMTKVQRAV